MKTVVVDLRALEQETGLSTAALRKVVLVPEYGVKLNGYAGHKLFSRLIAIDLSLQRTLSSSPMYSTLAARELVIQRVEKMKQIGEEHEAFTSIDKFAEEHNLNPTIHANLLARTQVVMLTGLGLSSYLLSPFEISTYEDYSIIWSYQEKLHAFARNVEEDMTELRAMYKLLPEQIDVRGHLVNLWERVEDNIKEVLQWQLNTPAMDVDGATVDTVQAKIKLVHYSNVPFLWLDILRAQGHAGKVIDGPNDGSRDVDTTKAGERYLTQVKTWRHPPIGAEMIRQHAQTCHTYSAKGYYVITHRFARNADMGQYPLHDNDVDERKKIAEVELVDMYKLVRLTLQYKIGITASNRFDERYWADMQIAQSRKQRSGEWCSS